MHYFFLSLEHSFVQSDIVTTISSECLEHFDKTDMEIFTSPTDDLARCWRSKVKVTAGGQGQIL